MALANTREKYLESIYYDTDGPAGYSGAKKLHAVVKSEGKHSISLYLINKWLSTQEAYARQRDIRRRFRRSRIIVLGIDDQWSTDLIDMNRYKKFNDGIQFILIVVDTFSKYMWLRPLKDKKGKTVAAAFEHVLNEGRTPNRLRSDRGGEFKAREFQGLMKDKNIKHFFSNNEVKAAISERAIKTLKTKMTRFMDHNRTDRYLDDLQNFAISYNKTIHGSTGYPPADVNRNNETEVWKRLYWPKKIGAKRAYKFKSGDHVRITHLRHAFTRQYDQTWSGEIFKIKSRQRKSGIPLYYLLDLQEDDVEGTFYESELQKVTVDPDQFWKIDEILKRRTKNRRQEAYVSFLYFPKKFNRWIPLADIKEL